MSSETSNHGRTAVVIGVLNLVAVGALFWLISKGNDRLDNLEKQLARPLPVVAQSLPVQSPNVAAVPEEPAGDIEYHSVAEAQKLLGKLGESPAAITIADLLAQLDSWVVRSDEENTFEKLKLGVVSQLRERVQREVIALQESSLKASTGAESVRLHGEAGRILLLYPMSADPQIVQAAQTLTMRQGEVAARVEVIRRQRYNQWATGQIKAAIDGYNANSSYWSPKTENPRLMDVLVRNLGGVDPALIEPAVLELYTYAMELTKKSISLDEQMQLAKRLTDPSVQRKMLGDF